MKKETRPIESFDTISFKDFGTLILTQGDQETLTVEADEELLPELITEVRNGKLVLGINDDWVNRIGKVISSIINHKDHNVTYTVTCVDLEKINISGKCILECDALQTDTLKINLAGFGNLNFKHLTCDTLNVRISGRGEFKAAGQVNNQDVRISGSGEYQTSELVSKAVKLVIAGQGNTTIRVEDSLDITISGLGQVNYYGQPKLRQVISGLGKSKRLNDQ